MRDVPRIKRILGLIEDLWNLYPDYRFGQLLINYNIVDDSNIVWHNEDDKFEEHLKAIIKEDQILRKEE